MLLSVFVATAIASEEKANLAAEELRLYSNIATGDQRFCQTAVLTGCGLDREAMAQGLKDLTVDECVAIFARKTRANLDIIAKDCGFVDRLKGSPYYMTRVKHYFYIAACTLEESEKWFEAEWNKTRTMTYRFAPIFDRLSSVKEFFS